MEPISVNRPGTQPLRLPDPPAAPAPSAPAPEPAAQAPAPRLTSGYAEHFNAEDIDGLEDLDILAAGLGAGRPEVAEAQAWVVANGASYTEAGRADLARLAADGRLTPALRDQLAANVNAELNPASVVVAEALLAHLADPATIRQGDRATCVAASAQKAIAAADPAQYFRLGWDVLADPEGAALPGGRAQLSAENRAFIDGAWDALTPEATAAKLDAMIQSALTDYANGEAAYDTGTDRTGDRRGLPLAQARRLNEALGIRTLDPTGEAGPAFAEARAAAQAGGPGPGLVVRAAEGGATELHMVMIRGVDPQGRLLVEDATGLQQAWDEAALAAHLPAAPDEDADVGDYTGAATTRSAPPPPPPKRH